MRLPNEWFSVTGYTQKYTNSHTYIKRIDVGESESESERESAEAGKRENDFDRSRCAE